MRRLLFLSLPALLLAACGGVASEHPASTGADTRLDERLLGFWRVEPAAGEAPSKGAPSEETVVLVGREAEGSAAMRAVFVTRRKDDTIGLVPCDVLPTSIAGKGHASVRLEGETESWAVVRYALDGPDVLRVVGMDERAVARDVHAGAVAGVAPPPSDVADPSKSVLVRLRVPTDALRAYLASRGDAVFAADRPLVLHRLPR